MTPLTVRLGELACHGLRCYVDTAVRLARSPALLSAVRSRLEDARLTSPVFNTPRYAIHRICQFCIGFVI